MKESIECALVGAWLSLSSFIRYASFAFGFFIAYVYFVLYVFSVTPGVYIYMILWWYCCCFYCSCMLTRENDYFYPPKYGSYTHISIYWYATMCFQWKSKHTNCTPLGKIKFDSLVAFGMVTYSYTRANIILAAAKCVNTSK